MNNNNNKKSSQMGIRIKILSELAANPVSEQSPWLGYRFWMAVFIRNITTWLSRKLKRLRRIYPEAAGQTAQLLSVLCVCVRMCSGF